MTGFLGDVLSGHAFRPEPERLDRHVWARHTPRLKRYGGVDPAAVLSEALAAVREALPRGETAFRLTPGRTAAIVDLIHRQANYISGTFDMIGQEVEVATPFYYRPLVSDSRPGAVRTSPGGKLYNRTLEGVLGQAPLPTDPTSRLANTVAARRGGYGTVNWPAVLDRTRPWLRTLLGSAPDLPLTRLALDSLDTEAPLPLALFAAPILDTLGDS